MVAVEVPHAMLERLVVRASREVQFVSALSPIDAHRERERLVAAAEAGRIAAPQWSYAPRSHFELRRALDAAERELAGRSCDPLELLYLERIRELSIEAALCAAAGTSDVVRLAAQRFPSPPPSIAEAARRLCAAWLLETAPPPSGGPALASGRVRQAHCARAGGGPLVPSDSDDPRSLLSHMRTAVGRSRLPFAVLPRAALAPLAATGERVILIATGRLLSEEDALRTVLHEIEGHAKPRARAAAAAVTLFAAGTARGVDDQEGRALLLEEAAGMLGASRRRQLAARHLAVEAMLGGATFDDVVQMLMRDHGFGAADAVVLAERVFRGSDGQRPGLGRERVYLHSLLRVRAHLEKYPDDAAVLACGQVAVEAASVLRDLVPRGPGLEFPFIADP
jgi:hypothetical protein